MKKLLAASFLALALAGCSSDDASGTSVAMTSAQTFDPKELTVPAGETVTWTNDSSESHTVTLYDNEVPEGAEYFSSGGASSEDEARESLDEALINEGDVYEVTFEEPGTYTYFCIPHEEQGMVATIVVEDE
jgi:plastocyanin